MWPAIEAARVLEAQGVSVDLLNIHTIKPLDEEAIVKSAKKTNKVITAEEHNVIGGLGSRVAQTLAKHHPCPIQFVGVQDSFGESGTPDELMRKYGLTPEGIIEAYHRLK